MKPKYERSFYVLGCVYKAMGKYEEALEAWNKYLSFPLDPDLHAVEEAEKELEELKKLMNKET